MNLITPEKTREAASLVRSGVTVSLSHNPMPDEAIDNPDAAFNHTMGQSLRSDTYEFTYHGYGVSHIDSLCHFWDEDGARMRRIESAHSADGIHWKVYEGQPNRQTENPTAKEILQAFGGIHRVRGRPWEKNTGYTTPLTSLQQQILTMLGLDEHIYRTQTNKPNRLEAFGQRCGQILAYFSHTFNHVLHTA